MGNVLRNMVKRQTVHGWQPWPTMIRTHDQELHAKTDSLSISLRTKCLSLTARPLKVRRWGWPEHYGGRLQDLSVPPSADGTHLDPKVISKVSRSDLSKTHHVIQELEPAPVSPKHMSLRFVKAMRGAYVKDYGYPSHLPSAWNDNGPIEWAHKFTFNRPAMPAGYVFSIGLIAGT